MENKINIAELLKDCPKGMELDSILFDDIYFDCIDDVCDIIKCYIQESKHKIGISFDKYGHYSNISKSKCVIFPKGKTTWEGFQKPFKDGDLVFYSNAIAIFKEWGDETLFRTYCVFYPTVSNPTYQFEIGRPLFGKGIRREVRLATEEEKQKLFDAIKVNGYKWNFETKTLEKLIEPKFKIGDKIKKKGNNDYRLTTIESINNNYYVIKTPDWFDNCYITDKLYFSNQDNYELVPSKFDITTLKPFDSRVLVRDANCYEWEADIFGRYSDGYITLGGGKWKQCIPYEGNEHLLGTTNDCDDFYKTWE